MGDRRCVVLGKAGSAGASNFLWLFLGDAVLSFDFGDVPWFCIFLDTFPRVAACPGPSIPVDSLSRPLPSHAPLSVLVQPLGSALHSYDSILH